MTEVRLFFTAPLRSSFPESEFSGQSSLLSQVEPETSGFLTKIYIVTGSLSLMIFPVSDSCLSGFGKFSSQIDRKFPNL